MHCRSLCMERGQIMFYNFFLSQTIINASAGSSGNNEGIGMGSLILKFAKIGTYGCHGDNGCIGMGSLQKLVPMVADEYMGVAVFLVVSHRYRSM